MSASPLPRSLRLTRRVTRGALLAATAGTGVLGVHLAGDHHVRTTTPTPAATAPTSPVPTTTATTPPPTAAPTAPTARPAAPRTTTPAAPRTTTPAAPRFTPVAPVAPAAGSGTGGGTTSGS